MKISTIVFPTIRGNRVFLANKKDGFGAGFLNGYGGKKKPFDVTAEDTAIREFGEEAGVVTLKENLEKIAIIDFFKGDIQIFECHIYFCRSWEGELCETEEMGSPELYGMDEMPFEKMWHGDRAWIPIIFSNQKIRGKVYYDEEMNNVVRFEYEPLGEVA